MSTSSQSSAVAALLLLLTTQAVLAGWDDRFGLAGPQGDFDGRINDVLAEETKVYVVGSFSTINSTPISFIGLWDGSEWSPVGSLTLDSPGLGNIVRFRGDIVVSGNFTSVNGVPADVAVWNGVTWSPLGNAPLQGGTSWPISVLFPDGDNLYIGGDFDERVVLWDGSAVQTLGGSTFEYDSSGGPTVSSLTRWNGDLVAGGHFDRIDGVTVNHIARWDGAQWHPLGAGLERTVGKVLTHDGDLHAVLANDVLRWTGSDWISVADVTPCFHGTSQATFLEGSLYRTTGDRSDASPEFFGVAQWNGVEWNDMEGGVGRSSCGNLPGALYEHQGRLLIGGFFTTAGGFDTSNLATWSGDSWFTNSPNGRVRAIAADGNDVYVAGDFLSAGPADASHIARWNGSSWSPLGTGLNGVVHAMTVIDGTLYVGGEFTAAGGVTAWNLARWDGVAWSPVSLEFSGPVYALATDGTDLFVGGAFVEFISSQSILIAGVARWDGSQWHAFAGGITNGAVRALLPVGSSLYVAGDFSETNGVLTGNIARWDGGWAPLELGLDNVVRAMVLHEGSVYVAGDFQGSIGSSDHLAHVAKWDGTSWRPLGAGTNGPVRAMASSSAGLILAGDFTFVGASVPANRAAAWTGGAWATFDEGLDDSAHAVLVSPSGLWVGGDFRSAGPGHSVHIARYPLTATSVGPQFHRDAALKQNVPNPFNPATQIRFDLPTASHVELSVYDARGKHVATLVSAELPAGKHTVSWNGTNHRGQRLASGVYLYRLSGNGETHTRKMLLAQ